MIMDVDILKSCSSSSGAGGSDSSSSSSSSMDMMAMMMQMEKFPELLLSSSSSDPDPAFYNTTTLTYPSQNSDDQFSLIGTTTLPIFSNIINNPNNNISVAPPPPPPSNFTNNPYQQQSMTPPPQFQLNNEASGMRLRGAHQNNKNYSSMAAMREMIFRVAVMQPIHIDPESIKAPKRRNVKISKDPQSVAARHRRERISERIRILQRLVPGGTKMDTASMLDEAIHYVKFLKKQVQSLEQAGASSSSNSVVGFTGLFSSPSSANNVAVMNNINYPAFLKGGCHQPYHHPLPMLASSASKQQLLS